MGNNEIIDKIKSIEEKFLSIKTVLEEKEILEKDLKYRSLYKGMINIQSKISFNPEILFLGINPGNGAFVKKNSKTGLTHYFPNELFSQNTKLNWLEDNNARKGKWYEINKKVNNSFPKQMLDILLQISNEKIDLKSEIHRQKFINEIADKVVYTNICPIATTDEKDLKKIFKILAKEVKLKNHWNGSVENFFRQRTIDLILVLKPKIIVCAGKSVYKSLFLKQIQKKTKVFSSLEKITRKENNYPFEVVTFSRRGTWNINEIANSISSKQHYKKSEASEK